MNTQRRACAQKDKMVKATNPFTLFQGLGPLKHRGQTVTVQEQSNRKRRKNSILVLFQCPSRMIIVMALPYLVFVGNSFYSGQSTDSALQVPSNYVQSSSLQLSGFHSIKYQKARNAAIIAITPDNKERLVALWSQLECFFGDNNKFDEVIISAPLWAKEEGLIDKFLQHAKETLPHFKDRTISLSLQYYTNDRYDIGLWCDALMNRGGVDMDGVKIESSILDRNTGSFILINDSIMAVEREGTQVLDVLKEKELSMTSLSYSLQGGYWVESVYRSFSKKGMEKFTKYACDKETMAKRCPMAKVNILEYKRCVVEHYEIHIGRSLFPRNEVWGIYASDAPPTMIGKTAKPGTPNIGRTTW